MNFKVGDRVEAVPDKRCPNWKPGIGIVRVISPKGYKLGLVGGKWKNYNI